MYKFLPRKSQASQFRLFLRQVSYKFRTSFVQVSHFPYARRTFLALRRAKPEQSAERRRLTERGPARRLLCGGKKALVNSRASPFAAATDKRLVRLNVCERHGILAWMRRTNNSATTPSCYASCRLGRAGAYVVFVFRAALHTSQNACTEERCSNGPEPTVEQ